MSLVVLLCNKFTPKWVALYNNYFIILMTYQSRIQACLCGSYAGHIAQIESFGDWQIVQLWRDQNCFPGAFLMMARSWSELGWFSSPCNVRVYRIQLSGSWTSYTDGSRLQACFMIKEVKDVSLLRSGPRNEYNFSSIIFYWSKHSQSLTDLWGGKIDCTTQLEEFPIICGHL